MDVSLVQVIDQVSKEKRIDRQVLIEAIEAAILKAAKRVFGDRELETLFNEDVGQVELFQYMEVVEDVEDPLRELPLDDALKVDPDSQPGDELGFQIFYREEDKEKAIEEDRKFGDILDIKMARNTFGRIAAQAAKQVIIQKLREAEGDLIYNEYKDRKGELVTGVVRRFERGDIIVDLGLAEAALPVSEQIPRESYRPGDRVQAYLADILRSAKGPQVRLSRTHVGLVQKLFELEVPEIYENIVRIMGIARDPGDRTKIAVSSSDRDVDPVGACVGMKGTRVQAIVQALKGEKIDIVPFSADLARYVCNAIAPAEVSRVLIDEDKGLIELIVPDDQLSLAIGKRGQNVRLASKLVGWAIEIFTETRLDELKEDLRQTLLEIEGIDPSVIDYLLKLGYHSVDSIASLEDQELLIIPGMEQVHIDTIRSMSSFDPASRAKRREDDEEDEDGDEDEDEDEDGDEGTDATEEE